MQSANTCKQTMNFRWTPHIALEDITEVLLSPWVEMLPFASESWRETCLHLPRLCKCKELNLSSENWGYHRKIWKVVLKLWVCTLAQENMAYDYIGNFGRTRQGCLKGASRVPQATNTPTFLISLLWREFFFPAILVEAMQFLWWWKGQRGMMEQFVAMYTSGWLDQFCAEFNCWSAAPLSQVPVIRTPLWHRYTQALNSWQHCLRYWAACAVLLECGFRLTNPR